MIDFYKQRRRKRILRAKRARTKLKAVSPEIPRISVFRSNRHIYAQVIDPLGGRVLASASDIELAKKASSKAKIKGLNKTEIAFRVGELLGKKVKELGIKKLCFDRGCYKYHGRIKALAEGARKGGLNF